MPQVFSAKGRSHEPPAPSGIAARLLVCSRSPLVCRLTLGAVLKDDPQLERRFLRLAQSPLIDAHCPGQRLGQYLGDSLDEVLLALQTEDLRLLVISVAIIHMLPAVPAGGQKFDRSRFWEHSVATGVLARMLVKTAVTDLQTDATLAFAAGLLHDCGRLLLDVHFPREFSAVLHYQRRHDTWIRDAEMAVLGYDHCLIGEQAARSWGLPDALCLAIGGHHQPDQFQANPMPSALVHANPLHADNAPHGAAVNLIGLVHVADILARGLQVGNPGDDTIPMLSETTLRRLGLNWHGLRQCLEEVAPLLGEVRNLVDEVMRAR